MVTETQPLVQLQVHLAAVHDLQAERQDTPMHAALAMGGNSGSERARSAEAARFVPLWACWPPMQPRKWLSIFSSG